MLTSSYAQGWLLLAPPILVFPIVLLGSSDGGSVSVTWPLQNYFRNDFVTGLRKEKVTPLEVGVIFPCVK